MSVLSNSDKLNALLQAQWADAQAVPKASIFWGKLQYDLPKQLHQVTQVYLITTYKAAPARVKPISPGWWQVDEPITVEVTVKSSSTCASDREKIVELIRNIIHAYQTGLSGVNFISVVAEKAGDAENLLRHTLTVNARYFHKKT